MLFPLWTLAFNPPFSGDFWPHSLDDFMLDLAMTPRIRKTLLMAAGILVLAAIVLFSFGPFSVGAIESRLATGAREALDARGHDWASVRMDGQRAIVTGAAPDNESREDALATVLASTWSGGLVAGGVTRVSDETIEARLQSGFVFRADVAINGRVLIRGDATDAGARDAIARYADANFPGGADTDLTLVPGGSSSPDWEEAAKRLLGQLARLDRGAVVLRGEQGALVGEAPNPQIAQSVSQALETMPVPFRAASVITPSGAPAEVRVADVEACSAVILAAQGTETLRFERAGATPSPFTSVALRRIGRMFATCPDTAGLTVSIRSDTGDAALDEARVAAVAALVTNISAEDPRIAVVLADRQDDAISFAIATLEG
ncbi:hypothetical protein AWH62_03030 [Maricaulis sp. W15]|uniref:hypothetical protein n=1 Tax=Maricaulis sp. W15 TaxID=1772333 RepID=UPI000948EAC6|nr:hypothetical protein [Maricaulis sp. W15]OLF77662.1 hypothetical protein AWH62_03030 [Maricaulis sp. W15]